MWKAIAAIIAVSLGVSGCWHATIETGRPPSGQVVENQWAHSFIGGLIPPSTVNTAAECPNGVARVETQHSILNILAHAITFGLYSPMTITVQCAAAGSAMHEVAPAQVVTLPAGSSRVDLDAALNWAAQQASELDRPVYVDFTAVE